MTMAANAATANLNILANAAVPNELHGALGRMGFTQATINYMTVEQGMDSLEEFRILTDDEVKNLARPSVNPEAQQATLWPPIPALQFQSAPR